MRTTKEPQGSIQEYSKNRNHKNSNQTLAGEKYSSNQIHQFQQTIGNQAVQRLLRSPARNNGEGPPRNEGEKHTDLPSSLRRGLEQVSGVDLSNIKIHRNSPKPTKLNALAYTQGTDIYLSPGQEDQLPHEGWHAVQQIEGRVQSTKQLKGVYINDDDGLEHEADVMGTKAASRIKSPALMGDQTESHEAKLSTITDPVQRQEDPSEPVLEAYKGKTVNKIGHISAPAGQYETAKSNGVNIRAKPDGTLPTIARVKYDTEVQVQALDNTEAFYFIISETGAVGWINKDFVALDPPEPSAWLHHITENNLTTILKNEYIDKNLWTLSTGNDYTTLTAAVVAANQGRKGVSVDWEQVTRYKDEENLKRIFDPWMIDNFAIYHGTKIMAGHNIWLPSPNYIRLLQESGIIGSRPDWVNTAVEIGKGIAGFFAGVVSGVFGSLWDMLAGLWELGKGIVNTVKSVLDGSLFSSIESLYNMIDGMTEEKAKTLFKDMVNAVVTMGKEAFNQFERQWEHPDIYKQWHFKGYIIGAVALEVILAIFTGGASLGAKIAAKVGKYLPPLGRILNRLLGLAEKLPRQRGGRDKGDADSPRRGNQDGDDRDMSKEDRAWEQARVMASMITEEHDIKDTPVQALIPLLNTTIAARTKVVNRYKAIQKDSPNTYEIIQLARRRRDVDTNYTEKRFRGPARKETDWEHIFERHWHGGNVARQRERGDIFGTLSKNDIKKVVDQAWKQRKKRQTQGERIRYRAKVSMREWDGTIEMWFNSETGLLITAYPLGRR